ncbi:PEP/pyruvate-binding domain-containing protein [Desulfonatronum thioautotrophicum]|uniref:PEP/pyruvate-binding domain-containing protein n=1 Tax=Desulfonatronum thioautotrophicum TaxID=617001 RepID=UPI00137938AC|nr:PEP/pyruvate-binding domain-containing protein [Desulfonatronum thioautotrophicum]
MTEDRTIPPCALDGVDPTQAARFGGKACALVVLSRADIRLPKSLVLGIEAYQDFLVRSGLDQTIAELLSRKSLDDMRWEEIWDLALTIRNRFLRQKSSAWLENLVAEIIRAFPSGSELALRSSSPGEDSRVASHAGLHESHVGLQGAEAVEDALIRVWSSLWSDRALLYRKELGLNPAESAMAVLIQECIRGECSGVAFSMDPTDESRSVIEAVPGMNESLVDGSTPPARWLLDAGTGRILETQPGPWDMAHDGFPREEDVQRIWNLSRRCADIFQAAQDVEWTLRGGELFCLQSRPITTGTAQSAPWEAEDRRPWYLSLHRSFENLRALRREVEDELLPELEQEHAALADVDLDALTNARLTEELRTRLETMQRWREIYWAKFIPLAHGVRLLGMVYNDALRPDDPYAFTALLTGSRLEAVLRNQALEALAGLIRDDALLRRSLEQGMLPGELEAGNRFAEVFATFVQRHGVLLCSTAWCTEGERGLISLLLAMAAEPPRTDSGGDDTRKRQSGSDTNGHEHVGSQAMPQADLEQEFLAAFPDAKKDFAIQVLELGRAAYRIRDNDNLALGRIQGELIRAVDKAQRRLQVRTDSELTETLARIPEDYLDAGSPTGRSSPKAAEGISSGARTFFGQPAGPGLARGPARVIREPGDLFAFQRGEILVCEAMDPSMSFVVPMAAAIVEARGGMLVHGAIIAREYGLPCVTGVVGAPYQLQNGDRILVDGYSGRVALQE